MFSETLHKDKKPMVIWSKLTIMNNLDNNKITEDIVLYTNFAKILNKQTNYDEILKWTPLSRPI